MRVVMIGTGYVGLVSGTCFADFGHEVVCVDKNEQKIDQLNQGGIPIYEPGLDLLVAQNVKEGRLRFTTDLASTVADADVVFVAVGTPSRRGDGHADLTYVHAAVDEIADAMTKPTLVVTKSTVPVGTNRGIFNRLKARRPDLEPEVASNPEFLREGSAIEDFKRPDRVVVGAETEMAQKLMERLYRPLNLNRVPLMITGLETAELIKYAANAFLATKITFINEMADLCEKVGANVQEVARGMGSDNRIGPKFLHAGPGYGGSCFPKDTLALVKTGQDAGAPITIVEQVVGVNEARKAAMADKILAAAGGDLQDKKVGILGVTFKPNTDDMRHAPSLAIIPRLQSFGAKISAHDPEGMKEAAHLLDGVTWAETPLDAIKDADVLVLLTEWDTYRALDLHKVASLMRQHVFVDLRNVYKKDEVEEAGFSFSGVGVPGTNIGPA